MKCDPKHFKHNLSLFIHSLTKQILVEPFNFPPEDMTETWRDFPKEYTMRDINQGVLQRLFRDSFTPPYQIEISQDMQEYVAFQDIPLFGAHFYYAFSPNLKISKWQNFEAFKVPRKYVEALEKLNEIQAQMQQSPMKGRITSSKARSRAKEVTSKASKVVAPAAKPKKTKPGFKGPLDVIEEQKHEETLVEAPALDISRLPNRLQKRIRESKALGELDEVS
jgi:hypothetical protein